MSTLKYNYRVRSNADKIYFEEEYKEELPWDRFSLPPNSRSGHDEFTIIQRPDIPELAGFVERYLYG